MNRTPSPIIVFNDDVTDEELSAILKKIPEGSYADIIIHGDMCACAFNELTISANLWVRNIYADSLKVDGALTCICNIDVSEIVVADNIVCRGDIEVSNDIKVAGNIICRGDIKVSNNITVAGNIICRGDIITDYITVAETLSCDGKIEAPFIRVGSSCRGNISARYIEVLRSL